MKFNKTYQIAMFAAVFAHVSLALLFMIHPSNTRPVFEREARHEARVPQPDIVKAVSVNTKEVTAVVQQLKAERAAKEKAVLKQQRKLAAEADALKARRVKEQRKLNQLRADNARAAEKRKQAARADQKRLEQIQKQKQIEAHQLDVLKKEQIALKKQQEDSKARAAEQARLEKARIEAANRARMSGVVDKYKALILGAIGQQWILPERVNTELSSRFKIKLAPNGAVLDVQLTRSSGDTVLDRSAQAAIYKASPLPIPSEPEMFNVFREIILTVRPENVRG
ncbi:MAG: cell envelope integrity protein TolA [Gammaproteobacteria bacterium]|nr:cell envelope integrity protein TolA [Gammaproteobacteria bacterium]